MKSTCDVYKKAEEREIARWSKFGSVKWAHVDFTAEFDGGGREFQLEYGPGAVV